MKSFKEQGWQRRRQFPNWTPRRTDELLNAGVTKWQLQRDYTRVAKGVWALTSRIEAGEYCIISRCRAQFLARPDLPITGFGALAMYGLKSIVEGQEVAVAVVDPELKRTKSAKRDAAGAQSCRRESVRGVELRYPDPMHRELACVSPAEAVVSALKSIRRGSVQWFVHNVDGWTWAEVRAIQLVDAVRRHFKDVDVCEQIAAAAVRRIDARWLRRILDASDPGADSPLETTMRLILKELEFGGRPVKWESQVPLYRTSTPSQLRQETLAQGTGASAAQGTGASAAHGTGETSARSTEVRVDQSRCPEPWLTVADQLSRELGLVLFFDGAHHREKRQHHKDTDIDAVLQSKGFLVLRVTEPMLRDPSEFRRRIVALLEFARAA